MTFRELTSADLISACADDAFHDGISISTRFEPMAIDGTVKPATYEGPVFQEGCRWIPDGEGIKRKTAIIVIDNEASQANRLEAALLSQRLALGLPHFLLDLSDFTLPSHLPRSISSFQFPHRNADAYLRDSELDGTKFTSTKIGKGVFDGTPDRPEALFEFIPTALLYGFWQSHNGKKGAQTKLARSWVSELIGIDPAATDVRVNGTKGDPLNLSIGNALDFDPNDLRGWAVTDSTKVKESMKLSEIGHGQVPFEASKQAKSAVSFREIRQTATISFASLRRITCENQQATATGRALLVALGIAAHVSAFGRSVSLRSGCDIRPVQANWMWLSPSGDIELAAPSLTQATKLLADCVKAAAAAGLPVTTWGTEIRLLPNPALRKAIELSYPELD